MTDEERQAYLDSLDKETTSLQVSPTSVALTDDDRLAFLAQLDTAAPPMAVDAPTESPRTAPTSAMTATPSLGLQDFFPMTRQVAQTPLATPMQYGASIPMDILNTGWNAAISTPRAQLQRVAEQRPMLPYPQALATELRGGEQRLENGQPSRIDPLMNALGEGAAFAPSAKTLISAGQSLAGIMNALRRPKLSLVDDVLATPEAKLSRLSPRQQAVYLGNRERQIKTQFNTRKGQLAQEKIAIQQDLGKKATERSLELRQNGEQFLRNQSALYRDLADAELAPNANKLVPKKDLAEFVAQRYAKDPDMMNQVSTRLGLTNEHLTKETTSLVLDQLGNPIRTASDETVKIGSLYTQAKEFGQTLPKGVRVYNTNEYVNDNAISTLFSFLEHRGVNLRLANDHWKSWVPVRDQFVREAKIFNDAGTQTAPFSRRLILQAKGVDPDNVNYAATVAKGLLGEHATIDDLVEGVKGLVSKLNTNQKEALALQLQQREAIGDVQKLRDSLMLVKDKQERQLRALKWVVGLAGAGSGAGIYAVKKILQ